MKTQPLELKTQELKQGLIGARKRVLEDFQVLEEELYTAVCFKTWVQNNPWFWVAGAVGVGFLFGVLSGKGD